MRLGPKTLFSIDYLNRFPASVCADRWDRTLPCSSVLTICLHTSACIHLLFTQGVYSQ